MKQSLCQINAVNLHFPKTNRLILENINYSIMSQDQIVLLGSNGSGKSSLLRVLNKIYQPTSGKVYLDGKLLYKINSKIFSKEVVTINQELRDSLFFDLSVLENIRIWEARYHRKLLKLFNKKMEKNLENYLAEFHPQLPMKLHTPVERLSGGEKQSLLLALCLKYPPKLLLLDEHTSAMDPKITEFLIAKTFSALKEYGVTCLMTTHDLNIALNYGDRLLMLENGQIKFQADYAEKNHLSRERLLEKYN